MRFPPAMSRIRHDPPVSVSFGHRQAYDGTYVPNRERDFLQETGHAMPFQIDNPMAVSSSVLASLAALSVARRFGGAEPTGIRVIEDPDESMHDGRVDLEVCLPSADEGDLLVMGSALAQGVHGDLAHFCDRLRAVRVRFIRPSTAA